MVRDHREGERGTPHVGIHKLGGGGAIRQWVGEK